MKKLLGAFACGLATLLLGASSDPLPLEKIKLPPGFRIGLYARVPHARSMALAPGGTLFVGTREEEVYAVRRGTPERGQPEPQEKAGDLAERRRGQGRRAQRPRRSMRRAGSAGGPKPTSW